MPRILLAVVLGVAAEKLHAERALNRIEVEIFAGALVTAEDAFGRNEFGDEDVGAVRFAELAKNLIGDAGHGREEKREAILGKPGQRSRHGDHSLVRESGVVQ